MDDDKPTNLNTANTIIYVFCCAHISLGRNNLFNLEQKTTEFVAPSFHSIVFLLHTFGWTAAAAVAVTVAAILLLDPIFE